MKNKTIVKFYRGCYSMGIVISVSYNNDRVIFDFGAPFAPLTEVYDGTVQPRIKNKVKDAIILGRIPEVDGVFDKEALQDLPVVSYQDSNFNTAILICHLHLDHMSEIDKVHPNIPIYIGKDGLKLNEILEEIDGVKTRDYTPFEYGQTIEVGCIKVKTFFNNHPCPGTASFLIQTPDQNVLYSGDIRFHGTKKDQAWQAIDEIAKEKIDLLIVDSTTTSASEFIYDEEILNQYKIASRDFLKGEVSEQDMYDQIQHSLTGFNGIGVYNQYPRDVDMLESMYYTALKCNRKLVLEPMYAYILYKLKGLKPLVFYPDTNDNFVGEKVLKENCETVTIAQMNQNPQNYLLQNSYRNILSLIDFDKIPGKYVHLLGEPLVKDCKEWKIMINFIEKLGWDFVTFINLYSFSHAYPNHLAEVIKTINPKTVVAVHSKHPENLNPVNAIQVIPEHMTNYILENGILTKE